MKLSPHILRFLLLIGGLLLGLQGGVPARASDLTSEARRFSAGRSYPEERAVLAQPVVAGNAALRQRPTDAGGGRIPAYLAGGAAGFLGGCGPLPLGASMSQYGRRNAHIVTAQFKALFPKHWFW